MFGRIFILLIAVVCAETFAVDYVRDIKPLLKHKCYSCHGALRQQGGLRLDTGALLLKGGESDSPVVNGEPAKSLLIDVLTGDAGFRMPPANEGTPFTTEEIQLVREWIANGAQVPKKEEPQSDPKTWWSYRPIERPQLPDVEHPDWCRNEIDHFVASERDQRGLPFVTQAKKSVWLRRVFLDLTGLPPTRKELHQFAADESVAAREAVVDDLLSRMQYGERWGRHWMDIWRYSDWYGSRRINEIRYSQRHIWRWRDWIIASLNADKGYDQMVREMLAADEIDGGNPDVLPATGYLGRSWYKFDRDVWMFETVERTGEAFLGLTFRCCRCHDHKFDPITHEEYYRFRAFFEPHDVRTDPISAAIGTEKDATLGQVLKDGIAMVYDKHLERPTFLFERGDSRYPVESAPLVPGIPASLGGSVDVQAVALPPSAWYPMLRPEVRRTLLQKADTDVRVAAAEIASAKKDVEKLNQQLQEAPGAVQSAPNLEFLSENFSKQDPDTWEVVNGMWEYKDGKLIQSSVTSFATMVMKQNHPADFKVRLRYRPLSPGTYRSVGFSFDYRSKTESQDVYTSTGDTSQSVQAFHRVNGKNVYPAAGIVRTKLEVEKEATLDVSVLGSNLTIDLNGERKLDYPIPVERKGGRFAIWSHQGAAEFLELKITAHAESPETLKRKLRNAELALRIAKKKHEIALAETVSVKARLAAEVIRHVERSPTEESRRKAIAAEGRVAVLQGELAVLNAGEAHDKLKKANATLSAAKKASAELTGEYTPLGDQFPMTSTGRRKALADWIANPRNPRTARVAANHLWSRHFGRPLVDTPENFGLNGRKPSHPDLLDWLASELIANDWQMKPIHRKIVLSATYAMSSAADFLPLKGGAQFLTDVGDDPDNQFFWRMNSRRMEAEVVRDSMLHLASRLNLKIGGPEISESDGEKTLRRSLYFRNTPNEKMPMLEVFDIANPNACYRRKESIVPHQSLAMMNSGLTLDSARMIATQLADEEDFVTAAFESILNRLPTKQEEDRCREFLSNHPQVLSGSSNSFAAGGTAKIPPAADPEIRARENLVHVLFLHNDFVTIR